ncbi:hypothetical protein P4H71_04280 [Paenibacillus kribbensis]|uniref:hypothetical protein n=1 Tax=Paenibacillus kribbensis TaxID=172713 RepID=UPI002DBA3A3F|nr:hypothetical protein [Paenibacillus kribbensis]MEC0233572.1 hypothetical protein [Paenibacillus kribbensis]
MNKQEYIQLLNENIKNLENLYKDYVRQGDRVEAIRIYGKIEGVKLAKLNAENWLGEEQQ